VTTPQRHPVDAYLARLDSAESKRTMRGCLRTIARMFNDEATEHDVAWEQIGYERANALREHITGGDWSPSTINKHLSALRGVVQECWRLGLIDIETAQRVKEIRNVSASRVPAGRALTADEIEALLYACQDDSPKGARDAAIIAVLALTGGRRAELVALDMTHWVPAERALLYHGKGDKQRVVHLAHDALPYLSAWLRARGTRSGPLFSRVLKSGKVLPDRLSGQAVGKMLGLRGLQAGIPHATPHDLRRTFAGDLLDAGADLSAVSTVMGHASTDTTVRYDRRPLRAQRDATDRLTLPPPRALKD
jgi:site-specific recombinase XerD